jgi:hypothetical protein
MTSTARKCCPGKTRLLSPRGGPSEQCCDWLTDLEGRAIYGVPVAILSLRKIVDP